MRQRPVVVTDMREPVVVVHRRMMRQRLVLMVIWIAGWIVAGLFAESHGYLATAILMVTGPGVWLVHYAWRWWRRPGERVAVRAPTRRALEGPASGASR
ncbi:hypothetical protein [Pseudonocardia sp. 73-21]|uniref:hypothetical protein n=1 Tax=Pseudonocardia sp. 73-21 TaxID=1895809 RepID=UPI000959F87E|nr:hypothetical protein [Pseudonocardia sp. 73-21]OJY42687.1 MAG: hypothetical protein BGP03_28200 [Pseudonocardia sp. 73-21]